MMCVKNARLQSFLILCCLLLQPLALVAQQPPTAQEPRALPPYYDYPYGSETTTRRTLSVAEAVTLALANASLYQQAFLNERTAREDVRQARTAFLPQFNVPLTYLGTTPSRVRADGEPLTLHDADGIAIVLKRGADGLWRFDRPTVEHIPTMHRTAVARQKNLQASRAASNGLWVGEQARMCICR